MKKSISILLLTFCISASSFSQIPKVVSYQGILMDTAGNTKPDGEYNFTFRLYETNPGGSAVWSESKKLIVKKGLFSTGLGDQTPFSSEIKFDRQYWLSIQIESEAELFPRIALSSTGYSISSINSDTARYAKNFKIDNGQVVRSINGLKDNIILKGSGGAAVTSNGDTINIAAAGGGSSGITAIQNTDNTLSISNPGGPTTTINLHSPFIINSDVGVGVNSPSAKLDVNGGSGTSAKIGIHGSSNDNYGIYGTSNLSSGVFGESGTFYGVRARTYNANSAGLYAEYINNSTNTKISSCKLATGDYAINADGLASFTGPVKMGIGITTPAGELDVNGGNGNGAKIGIHSSSNDNYGIYGTSNTSAGVFGESGTSFGVWARTYNNYALYAEYTNNGTNSCYLSNKDWSIYTTGPAYFSGDVSVKNLIYHSGTVKIDHPLDPANKYLSHSVVESPEMMNVYSGNVVTDANGTAEVNLPSYFQALNIDYRYQLTVIGQFAQAIVESKISNNRFTIKTDKPNIEVSWQVAGIRNDAFAKANPMIVEEEKDAKDRGKYLMPELFGQPKEKGINYFKPPVLPAMTENKLK